MAKRTSKSTSKTKNTDPDEKKNIKSGAKGEPKDEAVETAVEEKAGAEDKLAELNDKYLRLMAEYDNFRKRTIREKEEIIKSAAEKVIGELLAVLDNLDLATEHRKSDETLEEYVKGIAIIEDQFRAILAKSGLEVMDVEGQPFDPELHDAIMQMDSKDHPSGTIMTVTKKGYTLSGKVIRHPQVVVSK